MKVPWSKFEQSAGGTLGDGLLDPSCGLVLAEVLAVRGAPVEGGAGETGLLELHAIEFLRRPGELAPDFAVPFSRWLEGSTSTDRPNRWDGVALDVGARLLLALDATRLPNLGVVRAVENEKPGSDRSRGLRRCLELESARAKGPLPEAGLLAALVDGNLELHEYARRVIRGQLSREDGARVLSQAARSKVPDALVPGLLSDLSQAIYFRPDLWADRTNVTLVGALAHGLRSAPRTTRGQWIRSLGGVLGSGSFARDPAEDDRVRAALLGQIVAPSAGELAASLESWTKESLTKPADVEDARRLLGVVRRAP